MAMWIRSPRLFAASLLVLWDFASPLAAASTVPADQSPLAHTTEPMPDTRRVQVAIVGGGVAGLVAGYELEKRGYSTHLLEAADAVGGRVATARYGDGTFGEYGMHEMWDGNPLLDIARDLGVPLDEPGEAYSSVLINAVIYPYVQDSLDEYLHATFDAGELQAFRAFNDTSKRLHGLARSLGLRSAEVAHLQEISFEQWIRELGLPPKVAWFVRLSIECELGADWADFSALSGLLEFEIFFDDGKRFWHVRDGNQRLVEAMVRHRQGPTTTRALVTKIERVGQGAARTIRVYFARDHAHYVLEADRVILAVPFTNLPQIQFEPPLAADVWASTRSLSFGQYVVVHLMVDKSAATLWQKAGVDVPTLLTNGPLGVVYGDTGTSPAGADTTLFELLVYGRPARAWHMAPRDEKLAQIRRELDGLFPGLSGHIRGQYVYAYHPAAIPVWPPGRSPLDPSAEALRREYDGLFFAGDYTESAHSDGAARSAMRVADQISRTLPPLQPAHGTASGESSLFPNITRSSSGR